MIVPSNGLDASNAAQLESAKFLVLLGTSGQWVSGEIPEVESALHIELEQVAERDFGGAGRPGVARIFKFRTRDE